MTDLTVNRNYWLSGPFFRSGDGAPAGGGDTPPAQAPTSGDPPATPGSAAYPGRVPASNAAGSHTPGQADGDKPTVDELLQKNRELEEELQLTKKTSGQLGREVGDLRLLKRQVSGETLTDDEKKRVNELRGIFPTPVPTPTPPAASVVPGGAAPPAPVAPSPEIQRLEGLLTGQQTQITTLSQNVGNISDATINYHAEQRMAKDYTPEERKVYKSHMDAAATRLVAEDLSMEEVLLGYARSQNLPGIVTAAEKRGAADYAKKLQKNIDAGIITSGGAQPIIPGAPGNLKINSAEKALRITDPVMAVALYGEIKPKEPATPAA